MSTVDLTTDPNNHNAQVEDLGDSPPFPHHPSDLFWGYQIPAFRLTPDEHPPDGITFDRLDIWVRNPRFGTDGDEDGTYIIAEYDGIYLNDGRSINDDANAVMQAACCWDEVLNLIREGLHNHYE